MAIFGMKSFEKVILCCGLIFFITHCNSNSSNNKPLAKNEMDLILNDIDRVVKAEDNRIEYLDLKYATPEQIYRLFQMPETASLNTKVKLNALALAGKGHLLSFDKPSDIFYKLQSWFPYEISETKKLLAENNNSNKSIQIRDFRLIGALKDWESEPAAFLALAVCSPQIFLLDPAASPFTSGAIFRQPARLVGNSIEKSKIPTRNMGYNFSECIYTENSPYIFYSYITESWYTSFNRVNAYADQIIPFIRNRFKIYLEKNRCTGNGTDDCALIIFQWAGLTPDDPQLAKTIQTLEDDVHINKPLPELEKQSNAQQIQPESLRLRYGEALRRAAFIKAKITSILFSPESWPKDALARTAYQMSVLNNVFEEPNVFRTQYSLDYNKEFDPWEALKAASSVIDGEQKLNLLNQFESITNEIGCDVYLKWFKSYWENDDEIEKSAAEKMLLALISKKPLACININFEWLKSTDVEAAVKLRASYVDSLSNFLPADRMNILSGLTNNSFDCFDKNQLAKFDWLKNLCRSWISQPLELMGNSNLSVNSLSTNNKSLFTKNTTAVQLHNETREPKKLLDQEGWLVNLIPKKTADAEIKLKEIFKEITTSYSLISTASTWTNASSSFTIFNGEVFSEKTGWREIYILISNDKVDLLAIPSNFHFSYTDGELKDVTDIDADGNPELWFYGGMGECSEEDNSCYSAWHMGEVDAGTLSYFVNTPHMIKH